MVCARRIYINNAFIILGRDNDRHGNPDAETVARLEAAIAHVDQASCIVLTGHDYHNEGMRRWLSQNMKAKLPVYSVIGHDTIGQAVFSAPVTHALGIAKLTVITSDYHIPRSRAIFEKIHGACCKLAFIGAQHPVENMDAVARHEQASLALFTQRFAHAENIFDCMAILFDHHPRYQHIALERASRDPDSEDSRCIWEWKNDPVTRQMSRNTDVIPWDIHHAWYADAVNDLKKIILVAYVNGIHACMVRFDLMAPDSAEISINVNPSMRRKKLSKPILSAACKYGFDTLNFSRIYAEVKPENTASVKVFEDVGFVFQGMREGLRTYNLVH
jgi:RimJ/RimL family protein N-acetyltransferase